MSLLTTLYAAYMSVTSTSCGRRHSGRATCVGLKSSEVSYALTVPAMDLVKVQNCKISCSI